MQISSLPVHSFKFRFFCVIPALYLQYIMQSQVVKTREDPVFVTKDLLLCLNYMLTLFHSSKEHTMDFLYQSIRVGRFYASPLADNRERTYFGSNKKFLNTCAFLKVVWNTVLGISILLGFVRNKSHLQSWSVSLQQFQISKCK